MEAPLLQIIDAHTHADNSDFIQMLQTDQVYATINCASPREFNDHFKAIGDSKRLLLSAGIHPWKVNQIQWNEMQPIFDQVPIIGEIGLDNVWTTNPVELQKVIFKKHLSYALQSQKPVIIHAKGQELETLKILKTYPNRYLIHWYSSERYVQDFLNLGCYFSIGPSFETEASVQKLLYMIPFDRVLIESDGLESIAWALNRPFKIKSYAPFMESMIERLAQVHHVPVLKMEQQLIQNLHSFWGIQ